MAADWENDLSESNKDFMDCVLPVITPWLGGGTYLPVETMHDNELAKDLDIMAGIDVWQRIDGEGVRGVAARVQQGYTNWGTFTIRLSRSTGAETEYKKRKEAIETGRFIYPYLTCQAYVCNGTLLGVGVAKTTELFKSAEVYGWPQTNPQDGNKFICVPFDKVYGCRQQNNKPANNYKPVQLIINEQAVYI